MSATGKTSAESLLIGLRAQGFTLRLDAGQLLVSPTSKLTRQQSYALKLAKDEIKALLAHEDAKPPATDADLRAWFHTRDNPPPKNVLATGFKGEGNE